MSLAAKRPQRALLLFLPMLALVALGYFAGVRQQSVTLQPATSLSTATVVTSPVGPPATPAELDARAVDADIRDRLARMNLSEIWMDRAEVVLVLKYLRDVDTYLEWGSGGSTLNYPQFARRRAVSIEHHKEYCEGMPARLAKKHVRAVEFRCVSINHQNSEGTYEIYRRYVDEITRLGEPVWDFVFIDGRARVSAALRALSYLSDNSVVVVHDFERVHDSGQASYAPILRYYDVLDRLGETVKHGSSARGIGVLRRKAKFRNLQGNHEEVQRILNDGSQRRLF